MKLKNIIGVIALLLLMVGTASAFSITTVNDEADVPSDVDISIKVTYDADENKITFEDESGGFGVDDNPGITWVAYNLTSDAQRIVGYQESTEIVSSPVELYWEEVTKETVVEVTTDWTLKNNFGAGGEFGQFSRVYAVKNPGQNRFSRVEVFLADDFDGTIPPNNLGYEVGVHLAWGEDGSIFVAGPPDTPGIPEFPTIALPVAAILGLMFILGSRRKE